MKATSNSIAVIGGLINNNARIVISMSSEAVDLGLNARELASKIGALLGGGGSGRNDFAQAGGPVKEKLDAALNEALRIIKEKMMENT